MLPDVRPLAETFARAVQAYFPAQFPPTGAKTFSIGPLTVGVDAGASATVFDLTSLFGSGSGAVPAGRTVIITAFGVSETLAGGMTAEQFLWTFLVNGVPRWPVIGFTGHYGTLNAPTRLPGPGLILSPGDVFTVSVKNTSAQATSCYARVGGFIIAA